MIDIKNMSYSYGKKEKLYDDFSFKFESGKIYGLLGRNGSGKTTLLNIITSLLPNYKGEVTLDGMEANSRTRDYLQKFFYLPEISIEKNIRLEDLVYVGRSYPNWNEEKFLGFLEREGLDRKKKIKKLSKGWKKRVDFYFAISVNPEILILDEVSEGVDILAQKEIISDILDYFDEDKTVIIASHHIEEFENIIDDFIIIDNGELLFEGQKDYLHEHYGWVSEEEKAALNTEDILKERNLLGMKYLLIKNRESYYELDIKDIDLATFLKIMIDQAGDDNE